MINVLSATNSYEINQTIFAIPMNNIAHQNNVICVQLAISTSTMDLIIFVNVIWSNYPSMDNSVDEYCLDCFF